MIESSEAKPLPTCDAVWTLIGFLAFAQGVLGVACLFTLIWKA